MPPDLEVWGWIKAIVCFSRHPSHVEGASGVLYDEFVKRLKSLV